MNYGNLAIYADEPKPTEQTRIAAQDAIEAQLSDLRLGARDGLAVRKALIDAMPENEPHYTTYTLLSIDASRDEEGEWGWNESDEEVLVRDIVMADSEVTPRKVLRNLRKWGYLTEESKGQVYVYNDGGILEIQAKGTYEPLLALVPIAHY